MTRPKLKRPRDMLKVVRQGAEITMLAPLVASARMRRLSSQRPTAAAANLAAMAVEKAAAFGQAWSAMAAAGMRAQFKFAMAMWAPNSLAPARVRPDRAGFELAEALVSTVSSAMQPLHARVKRNASKHKRR